MLYSSAGPTLTARSWLRRVAAVTADCAPNDQWSPRLHTMSPSMSQFRVTDSISLPSLSSKDRRS